MTKNWEREKDRMHDLYMVRGMKLSDMRRVMEEQYNFHASERAYKQKFKEWRWFKKTPRPPSASTTDPDSPPPESMGRSPSATPYGLPHYTPSPGHRLRTEPNPYEPSGHPYPMFTGHDPHEYGGPSATSYEPLPVSTAEGLEPLVQASSVSLPSVSYLHHDTFKQNVREAEMRVELGQYDQAQAALENAMSSLQWLRGSG